MAVASFLPAAVVYREEQYFDWWVYALFAAWEAGAVFMIYLYLVHGHLPGGDAGALSGLSLGLVGASAVSFPLLLVVGFLRMTTEVMPTDVRVWFGWIPTYRRFVAIGDVRKIEVVQYRPILDYGGWGIRGGRDGERVLNARGNRGVRLDLADGTRLLIGSQRPEALAVAIERALRPGV